MHGRALVAHRRVHIAKMTLKLQNLPQEFHIAPRKRKNAEARAQLLRAAMLHRICTC